MAKKRQLQIDVKTPVEGPDAIKCIVSIDGRDCTFYTSRDNYQALILDKVFIRDGKTKDSAGCYNTTHVFEGKI